jgi:hypothetical protein
MTEGPMKDDEAVKPGMLVVFDSSGEVIKHASSGGNVDAVGFAMPEDFQTFKDSYADVSAFANGSRIRVVQGYGARYAWLAASQTIVQGDPLESNGDGTLKKHAPADETTSILHNRVVGYAQEAKTTGVGAVSQIRIMPRV